MNKMDAADPSAVCLMVHGLFGSATLFRQKTGAIRKLCKKLFYAYIDAPLLVTLTDEKSIGAAQDSTAAPVVYAWFRHTPVSLPVSKQTTLCNSTACWTCRPAIIHDFELGLNHFRKAIVDASPACILCFSQGATIALIAILLDFLDMYEGKSDQFRHLVGVRSIILASPWVPHPCQLSSCDEPQQGNAVTSVLLRAVRAGLIHKADVQLPFRVLVVYGNTDSITPPSGIEYLRSICPFFKYVEHPGGHLIPTAEPVRTALRNEFENITL